MDLPNAAAEPKAVRWFRRPITIAAVLTIAAAVNWSTSIAAPPESRESETAAPRHADIEELPVIGQRRKPGRTTILDDIVTPSLTGGIAVWRDDLCIAINGVHDDSAKRLFDRIRSMAARVKLKAMHQADGKCQVPNASIIFVDDLKSTLLEEEIAKNINRKWVPATWKSERADDRFGQFIRWVPAMSTADYRAWAQVDTPIKSWFYTKPYILNPTLTYGREPSRRSVGKSESLENALIFVEFGSIVSAPLETVGDSLAFILLAAVEPVPRTKTRSEILGLYTVPPNPSAEFGAFDVAFLSELYVLDHLRFENVHLKRVTLQRKLCAGYGYCR